MRNRDLTVRDVPAFDVASLGRLAPEWSDLNRFALSFDGYGFSAGRFDLPWHANAVRRGFAETGELLIHDLSWLRALLFADQRRYHHTGEGLPGPRDAVYIQGLLDAIRAAVLDRPDPIATKRLRARDVPQVRVDDDDQQFDLAEVWRFARTFDALRYFAVDEFTGRLGTFAESVRSDFGLNGRLAHLGEIGLLRACLAFEQQRWYQRSHDGAEWTLDDRRYVAAVLDGIRGRVP